MDGPLSLGRRELLSWLRANLTSLATTKMTKRDIKASEGLSRLMESMLSVEDGKLGVVWIGMIAPTSPIYVIVSALKVVVPTDSRHRNSDSYLQDDHIIRSIYPANQIWEIGNPMGFDRESIREYKSTKIWIKTQRESTVGNVTGREARHLMARS